MAVLRIESFTTDRNLQEVYSNPYIIRAFKKDGADFKPNKHNLIKYYSCFINSEFVGCFMHIQFTKNEIEAHSLLLKKALKYSRELGQLFIESCFKDKNVTRITTYVPADLKTAINYLLKLNWKIEGIKRNSIIKKNKELDTYMLGITRKDNQ